MHGTVVVPLDGSSLAERALPFARALVGEPGGRLVLVRCASAAPAALRDLAVAHAEAVAEAEVYLRRVAAEAGGTHPWLTEIAVPFGPAAEGILAAAAQHRADAIAMTTWGCTGGAPDGLGSVAAAAVQLAGVPLLLVRPGAPPARPAGASGALAGSAR